MLAHLEVSTTESNSDEVVGIVAKLLSNTWMNCMMNTTMTDVLVGAVWSNCCDCSMVTAMPVPSPYLLMCLDRQYPVSLCFHGDWFVLIATVRSP